MATANKQLAKHLLQQPDDSSSEEIVREPAFGVIIQTGLKDSDEGRTIPGEEMRRRVLQWRA